MSVGEKAAFIIAEAILDFHVRNMKVYSFSPVFVREIDAPTLHQLSYFAKQGVKVRLK